MAVVPLRLVTPNTENRTVTPRRRPNAELRTREYLTEAEVGKLGKLSESDPGQLDPHFAAGRKRADVHRHIAEASGKG